jgi:hypothetical protein
MATNKSMIEVLERGAGIISELKDYQKNINELVDELSAMKPLLKQHLGRQKRQKGILDNMKYIYDKKKRRWKRYYPN